MTHSSPDFLALFREEATERLENMSSWLIEVERGRSSPEAIENIFREAHTIKGAAGMLGMSEVHDLAHVLEDILSDARESGHFPEDLTDPLLRSIDSMRQLIAGTGGTPAALIAELVALRDTGAARTDVPGGPVTPPQPGGTRAAPQVVSPRVVADLPAVEPVVAPRPAPAVTPRRSVHVAADKIDRLLDLVGETSLHQSRLQFVLAGDAGRRREVVDELDTGDRLLDELKTTAIGLRTVPLSSVLGVFPRSVRDLALAAGKEVELEFVGIETELDRTIVGSLPDVLTHVLRNAVAHGIEPASERIEAGKVPQGTIRLSAEQRGSEVEVTVADDGRGVTPAVLDAARAHGSLVDLLTRGGYSTAGEVTELAGRGVGLDAVRARIEAFGGRLDIRSMPGEGTAVVMLLPLSLALLEVLLVERGETAYGIPLFAIEEVLAVGDQLSLEGRSSIDVRGHSVPLFDLAGVTGGAAPPLRPCAPAAVVAIGERRAALAFDTLLGQEEIVVKPLGLLAPVRGFLGGAILGDGRIALLLDPAYVFDSGRRAERTPPTPSAVDAAPVISKVLVVEDFVAARELQRTILEGAGYHVVTAVNGQDALDRLDAEGDVALVISDVEMPVMDGFSLAIAIRSSPLRSALPIIIVTSRESDEDRRRGLEAGADAYLTKSRFSQDALLDAVERLIGRSDV